jgi:Ser-tRNA(Ala) deacylase AlaX
MGIVTGDMRWLVNWQSRYNIMGPHAIPSLLANFVNFRIWSQKRKQISSRVKSDTTEHTHILNGTLVEELVHVGGWEGE